MHKISRVILAAACAAALAQTASAAQAPQHHGSLHYHVTILSSLGGTNSRANSLDDLGIVGGYSKVTGNAVRHATLWSVRAPQTPIDLSSLGGAGFNSSIGVWRRIRSPLALKNPAIEDVFIGDGKDFTPSTERVILDRQRGYSRIRLKARFLGDGEVRELLPK
jgi:hypothetical protein